MSTHGFHVHLVPTQYRTSEKMHAVITESNKTQFKALLPPDVTYVCSRTRFLETYYYFMFKGRYVVFHWSRLIDAWGAWVPDLESLQKAGLAPVENPADYPAEREFFEGDTSVGRESARGLLAAVWYIVSECKEGRPKFYGVNANVIVDRLVRVLKGAGLELDADLKRDIEMLLL